VFCQFVHPFLAFLYNHFLQADCLDDSAFAIMQEMSKLSCRLTEEDVIRGRNQVFLAIMIWLCSQQLYFLISHRH
jgi:hypothetical protein